MTALINLVLSLLLVSMLAAVFWLQWDIPKSAASGMFQEPLSGPLVLLTVGPLFQLAVLALCAAQLRDTDPRVEAFPRLFGIAPTPDHRTYQWEVASATLCLGLPLIGFGWCWNRFLTKGEAWVKPVGGGPPSDQCREVGLFERLPACEAGVGRLDFSFCRYGARHGCQSSGQNGADFLPFWQPLFMAGLSALVLLFTALLLRTVWPRLMIRRRADRSAMVSRYRRRLVDVTQIAENSP